jgi:hypothetical protein
MFEFEPGKRHVGKDLRHVWADVGKAPGGHVAIDHNHSFPQSARRGKAMSMTAKPIYIRRSGF